MTELTKELNVFSNGSAALTFEAGDYLYIGTYFPINHKYLELSMVNGSAATVIPEIWDGSAWKTAIDVLDFTENAGATLGQSGNIQFAADTAKWTWSFVNRTLDTPSLPEFSGLPDIYEKYWSRIGFTATLSATIDYVGDLFCTEDDLLSYYPSFNEPVLLNSWETGKTDWKKQRVDASEYVVNDLRRRNIIMERSQIIELSKLVEPAIRYSAYLIYNGLGARNYSEEADRAMAAYKDAMNQVKFEVDVNSNSRKDRQEMSVTVNRFTR
jgi:hypothetical protein